MGKPISQDLSPPPKPLKASRQEFQRRIDRETARLKALPMAEQRRLHQEAVARNPGLVALAAKMQGDQAVRAVVKQAVDKAMGA